jgi:hypothetical protein
MNVVQVIFNQRGEREAALTSAAQDMSDAFKVLLQRLIDPPRSGRSKVVTNPNREAGQSLADQDATPTTAILLASFDEAWVAYLEQFVAWKFADAASLEVNKIYDLLEDG